MKKAIKATFKSNLRNIDINRLLFLTMTTKLSILLLVLAPYYSQAQPCDPTTPSMAVNLSASPTMSWTSPSIQRNGNCCGTTAPDVCLEFIITLNANATSINFQISSGAVPPGALYYQINCGPQIPVGSPICLTGPGPDTLTFCKPGNNNNTFTITSYSAPTFGPDLVLNNGCSGILTANYYNESTITWNSISPGTPGQYNSNLSCILGCDTSNFTSTVGLPDTILYQVCGYDINGCIVNPICHVFTVTNIPAPTTNLPADTLLICPGDSTIWVNANPNSTTGPYNLSWSGGTTADSALLSPGWHYVSISDTSNCLTQIDSILVIQNLLTVQAQAGADQIVCQLSTINLTGININGQNPHWWGGNGVFSNAYNNTTNYTLSTVDQANGYVQLFYSIDGFGSCPGDVDSMSVTFAPISSSITLQTTNISCFGDQNGTATISGINTQWQPFQYILDNGTPVGTNTFTNLGPGTHTITVINNQGCDTTLTFVINQPNVLAVALDSMKNVKCFGLNTGQIHISAQGGTPVYQYNWLPTSPSSPNSPSYLNLSAGTYICNVVDINGCSDSIVVTITQPSPLLVTSNFNNPLCHDDPTPAQLNASGGVAPYNYTVNNINSGSSLLLYGGNYNVQVTDANNCTSNANFTITPPASLHVWLPSDTIVCANTPITIYAVTNGGTPVYDYNWSLNSAPNASSSLTFSTSTAQFINVTVIDQNNCTQSASIWVNVYSASNNNFNLTKDSVEVCVGDLVKVDYSYNGTTPIASVFWMDCFSCGFPRSFTPSASGMAIVILTTTCGDILYDTVFFNVHTMPNGIITPQISKACQGDEVTFGFSPIDQNAYHFLWVFSDGQFSNLPNPSVVFSTPGYQTVTLTLVDTFGCVFVVPTNTQLMIYDEVTADFNHSPAQMNMYDPTVHLTNTSTNASVYFWDFNDGTTSTQINPSHTFSTNASQYSVTLYATSLDGCVDSITKIIPVKPDHTIFVPNTFTPDGNEHNNYFSIKGFNVSEEDFLVRIYDRWGHEIFESKDLHFQWDGRLNETEREATQGTYTWTIVYQDIYFQRNKITGHITLLR